MLLENERKLLIEYGKKMLRNGLTIGTGGNLSIYNREKKLIALTPSSIPYEEIKVEDICVVDINGKEIDCKKKITSESEMHLETYRKRSDVNAIIHSHAKYSTIFAVLHKELKPILHVFGFAATDSVKVAPYQTYGSKELAKVATKTLGEKSKIVLLANHGNLVVGSNIFETFSVLEEIEFCAEIQWKAECIGVPKTLTIEEIHHLSKKFYGQGY